MRVFRSWQPVGEGGLRVSGARELLDVRLRRDTADVIGVARCPRCRAVLVARVKEDGPGFFCRCLARLPIPA
jgi:hypothetical protein